MNALMGNVGTPVSVQVHGTDSGGSALTYSAAGLPAGLSIDSATGLITGTPTHHRLQPANGHGYVGHSASEELDFPLADWTIRRRAAACLGLGVSMTDLTNHAGLPIEVGVPASATDGGALTYTASGLPLGLSLDPATGFISGTPTTPGIYPVSVTVTDITGPSANTSFSWTIDTVIRLTIPGLGL